jgi:lipid-A-disaccharide synthase
MAILSDARSGAPAVMLVAGEASGDLHGATLCRAIRELAPACRLFGMGGARMAEAGMELLADVSSDAVVGWTEALSRLPALRRAYRRLKVAMEGPSKPDVLVLIDFPEFNIRLARAAGRVGVPVVYFIPPQIWAWRGGRIKTIRRLVARVLAVLPFETALYRSAGVPVEFVGHPVLDLLAAAPQRSLARRQLRVDETSTLIGLLPGSRREEVSRLLPEMREAAARIAAERPDARFVLALAPTVDRTAVECHLAGERRIEVVSSLTYAVMAASDLVLVASGTATLEAALLGAPMVVCYRVSRLSELVGRLLIRVPWISLVNITLGRAVVPELCQSDATGERIGSEALRLLNDSAGRKAQREAFAELSGRLGAAGVGARAARSVLAVAGYPPGAGTGANPAELKT